MMGGDPGHAPGTEMEDRPGCSSFLCWNCCPHYLPSRFHLLFLNRKCYWSEKRPSSLRAAFPPICSLPGGSMLMFLQSDVLWLNKISLLVCMSQRKRVTWLRPMHRKQLSTWRRVVAASWMENLIPYLKCSVQCRVVITLISSSVHGCLWSFQGRAERDRNHGSAMDDYLATPDQRFPSISSEDKEKSISSTLWKYLCLLHSTVVQQGLGLSQPASNRGSRISAHACQDAREAPQTAALRGS